MLKSLLKAFGFIAFLAGSSIACAAGLGSINVTSSLGQPLNAEIEVVSVANADKSGLKARLASADAYKNAGVDYPYGLPKLKLQIEGRANGDSYIKVTTAQPVNEPFITLLVELIWPSGKLLREYTFLIDPPDYKLEQPKAEEVKPIEPILAAPAIEPASTPLAVSVAPAVTTEPLAKRPTVETAAPAPVAPEDVASAKQASAEPVPAKEITPEAAPTPSEDALSKEEAIAEPHSATPTGSIVVKSGDSLSKIAAQIKPADVSLERMLVALYRENASVFDGHNMNRVRAGKILNIPQGDAIQMLPQADAVEEVRAQAADWNAYRQKLAAAHAPATEPVDKQEAAGKISTAVTDKAVPQKEPAKEVLKLSKGEAPNEKALGNGKASAKEKAIAMEEESIAKSKALKETQERTAILEKNIKDMQHLAELKKEAVVASAVASAPVVTVPLSAASAPQAVSAVAEAQPKPKPKPVAPKIVEQPSLTDQLLNQPLYLAGAVAVILLAVGGFIFARRRKQGGNNKEDKVTLVNEKAESEDSPQGRFAEPVASSPETGDFTSAAEPVVATGGLDSEEVDPIGEADLFLTFGRDAQAEEVLKEALKKNPNNIPVKLKLMSIYLGRKDTTSLYSYAREIKESGDVSAWEQAVKMGLEADPTNPFYGGSGNAAPAAAEAAPAVDFDLGFNSPAPAAPDFSSHTTVVLETTSIEKTGILSSNELQAASQATPMDFDITGGNSSSASGSSGLNQEETTALNMDDLVFDVTASHTATTVIQPPAPAVAAPADDGGMAFTLDFPTDFKKPEAAPTKTASVVPDMDLGDISLNMDSVGTPAGGIATGQKDEHWHEVATKLDLAKAYQEMGDASGAREILDEVVRDGDEQQRETAQTLLQQL